MQKLYKISIKDWGTVEKIQRKFKKVIVLSNICRNFEEKLEEYFEKFLGDFENHWENFYETWVNNE